MNVDLDNVVRDLAPRLYRYALGRIGDAGLAEDVAQESLIALGRQPRQRDARARSSAWSMTRDGCRGH
jgi:DNA-directed RNA polymerase specialized sigma24 family protein